MICVASFKANTSRCGVMCVEDRLSQLCKDSQGTLQLVLLISSSKSLGLVYASCHQDDHEMLTNSNNMLLWQVQMREKHENWQLCH